MTQARQETAAGGGGVEAGEVGVPAGGRLVDQVTLGVLAGLLPRERIDEVLVATGRVEQRVRRLPAHLVVRLLLALSLFPDDDYEEVVCKLVGSLQVMRSWERGWQVPTSSAVTQARRRLGPEPLRELFVQTAVPVAEAGTKGAWCAGRRVMALDGFVLDVPDTPANEQAFGRSGNDRARSAFPQVRVVGLAEVGSRVLTGAAFGPWRTGEQTLAADLVERVEPGMLVLADRNFHAWTLWHAFRARGAELLWRVKRDLTLPVLAGLPDGSFRSALLNPQVTGRRRQQLLERLHAGQPVDTQLAVPVRVIEYEITDRGQDPELITLVTSLLDPAEAGALLLASCYAQRWEIELLIGEVKIHQRARSRVLRSRSPELIEQELWALLLTHYAIRALMCEVADLAGHDPDSLSFLDTVRVIRRQVADPVAFPP